MAGYQIRKYKDCDYEVVCSMFAEGMREHIPAIFMFLLKSPLIHVFLLGVFLVLLAVFNSYLLSTMAIVVLLAAGRLSVDFEFNSYIQQCFREDLLDIQESYMRKEGACFWVAESNGEIVGMVAGQPPQHGIGEAAVELRRMSVGKTCRGQGIGKALCRTVISFACEQGCKVVILETSAVQLDAHGLYESVGFHQVSKAPYSSFLGQMINFSILRFRYDIPAST